MTFFQFLFLTLKKKKHNNQFKTGIFNSGVVIQDF